MRKVGAENARFAAVFLSDEPVAGHEGAWGGPLSVRQVTCNPSHDLAVITLDWPEIEGPPMRAAAARLTTDEPAPGEHVLALGYTNPKFGPSTTDQLDVGWTVTASTGTVNEVFADGIGIRIDFPAATGDFPIPGGLSDGPIIDSRGRVFAVASSSLSPTDEHPFWSSTASLIGPALDLEINMLDEGKVTSRTIRALAELGIIGTDGELRPASQFTFGQRRPPEW